MDHPKYPETSKLRFCKASAYIPEWRRLEQGQSKPPAVQPKPQAPTPKKSAKKKPKAASTSTNTKQAAAVPIAEALNGIITTDKGSILSQYKTQEVNFMVAKKKVLLKQEASVPENTVLADGTISSAGPPADAAVPPDSGDLSVLLASMGQTNDSASTNRPDGDATLEGPDPPFELMETKASDEAASEGGGTASGAPPDSDEPAESTAGEEEAPSNLSTEGTDDIPAETVSETVGEPAPPKPRRAPRRKKTASVEAPVHDENENSTEAPAAEEQAMESSASVEGTAPLDEGETPILEDIAS